MINPVRGLGRQGIILDTDAYDIPLEALSDGNNIRIVNGKIARVTGAVTSDTGSFDATFSYGGTRVNVGSSWLKIDGTDVTPTSFTAASTYSTSQVGDFKIVVNPDDAPFVGNGGQFSTMTNWPSTLRAERVIPFQGFLIATGLVDGGTDQKYRVRFSDTVDPGTINPSWDYTVTTNLAGFNDLDQDVLDVKQLGGIVILYTRNKSIAMEFTGGTFVFGFRDVNDDDGIICPGAVAEFNDQHLVVGNDTIYVFNGNAKQSIADGRVADSFYRELGNSQSVRCLKHEDRNEIWVLYSTDDSIEADRCLIYNYQYNAWTKQDLPAKVKSAVIGPRQNLQQYSTWQGNADYWSTIDPADFESTPFLVTSNRIYQGDTSYGVDGVSITSFFEQRKLDLDQLFGEVQSNKRITRLNPQVSGSGQLVIKVAATDNALGITNYQRSATFNIETDHKVDVRAKGRYLAIRFEMTGLGFFETTGYDLHVEKSDGR